VRASPEPPPLAARRSPRAASIAAAGHRGPAAQLAHDDVGRDHGPPGANVRNLEDVFAALTRSRFRGGFALAAAERRYLETKGRQVVLEHGRDFIARRLAPATPANDGKQTPLRGHPVFVAQHATATCCRGCLAKWHGIGAGHALTASEQAHVLTAIARWLEMQSEAAPGG
jgi:predicted Fe-S protein YdhL (DUF1289 family)